jgi:hypothetical protein
MSRDLTHDRLYFIVDDCIDERGTEGFALIYGDPWTAVGVSLHVSRSIKDLRARVPEDEPLFRVRLARRHGWHSVCRINGAAPRPFEEHGMWAVRGHNALGEHFNRSFRTKAQAAIFATAMHDCNAGVERY